MLRNLLNQLNNFVSMVSSFSPTFRRYLIGVFLMRRNYFVIQWLDFQMIWFISFRSNYHCYVTPYSGKVLVNTGSGHNMSPDGTEPLPDPTLTKDLQCPNMILENTWNISDKHLFSRTLSHIPEGGVLMRHFSRNSWWLPGIIRLSKPWYPTSTPIHAKAWKEKALAGYNSQQIPTNNDIHKMLIIIISLRRKHFVIISYLYKIPTINEPYNQRKRDIRQTHTDILTA